MRRNAPKTYTKSKACLFCQEGILPDYKDVVRLRRYLSERGRIIGARKSGNCSRHQRAITGEIKRARFLAMLPYTARI